jgi:hypothetical protein
LCGPRTLHNGLKLLNLTQGYPNGSSVWNISQRLNVSKLPITIDNNICNCFDKVYNYKLHSTTVRAAMSNVLIPQDTFSSENKPSNATAEEILFKI